MHISDYSSYLEHKQALAARREKALETPAFQRAPHCFRCGVELPDWNTDHADCSRDIGNDHESYEELEQLDYEATIEIMYQSSLADQAI